jgi:hypothetical protein
MVPDRPKRLLIVEEALRSTDFGHWYEYIRTIAESCRAEGVEVQLLINRRAEKTVVETLHAEPKLRYSAWDGIYASSSAWKRYSGVIRHNFRLLTDVASYLATSQYFDVVLAPTNLAHHVLGWYRIAKRFAGTKFGRLALIFVNTPGSRLSDGTFVFPRNTWFMRAVLNRMNRLQREGRLTLAAETTKAAQHFKEFCGLDFALYPHVVSLPHAATNTGHRNLTLDRASRGSQVTLGSLGFARLEKGSLLLQEALVSLLHQSRSPGVRFVMQWGRDANGSAAHNNLPKAKELVGNPCVEFIDRGLSTDEYWATFCQLDGLILPYRSDSYYNRVSRVAIEAACAGLPFIYPRDSWLADLAKRCGAGVAFEDGNLSDLVRAIRDFCAGIRDLKAGASDRLDVARQYHSPARLKACLFCEADDLAKFAF